MQKDVDASFSYKSVSGGVNFGVGKGFSNTSLFSNEIEQMSFAVLTLRGRYGTQGAFSIPNTIDNFGIDFTNWATSCNDQNTHTLVEIKEGGLLPLSALVIEENLKKHFDYYLRYGHQSGTPLSEPTIQIACNELVFGGTLTQVMLYNRFNDPVLLYQHAGTPETYDQDQRNITELADKYSQIYNLRTEIWASGRLIPTSFAVEFNARNDNHDIEAGMKKYVDTARGMTYLLYNSNGKKVGYSIYTGEGDFLLDTYGIRAWVNGMQSTTVSDNELLTYTLVAL